MGRTSVALGAPDSSSGIMDGFTPEFHVGVEEPNGDPTFGVDRVGSVLPTPAPSAQETETTQEEVAQAFWCQLPRDEQVRFACYFSEMLLKCFNGTQIQKEAKS